MPLPEMEACAQAAYAVGRELGAETVFVMGQLAQDRTLQAVAPEDAHALEKAVLQELRADDVVLLCGGRHMEFNLTLRRFFGLTDGFIPNSW